MKNLRTKKLLSLVSLLLVLTTMFASTLSTFAVTVSVGDDGTANFTNAKFYILGSSNVTTYTSSSGTTVSGSIYPNDLCTVLSATGTYWKVSYPTSNGSKTAYCNKSNILNNTSYCKRISIGENTTVYTKSDMSTHFGTVYTTDTIYMLSPISSGKAQIIYPTSDGYKIGWIYASVTSSSTWRYPMDNYYCTWSSSTNLSWGNYNSNSSGRNYHVGIDIYGTSGKVYAAATGTVAAVGFNSSNGNYVVVEHRIGSSTVYSFYAHLSSYSVSKGNSVSAGQQIGIAGKTGSAATGVHLHFAIIDSLNSDGGYYGYVTSFSGNKVTYSGRTFYNPNYVISYNALP